jgi:hypothetical protein
MRKDYPFNEALDDLTVFFESHIKDEKFKKNLMEYIELCRKEKTVTMRSIHEEFFNYRKDSSDYSSFSEKEKEMLDDLFHFWG